MIFNEHLELIGRHAVFGASKYHWVNYDPEKLELVYRNSLNNQRGTELHELAHRLIKLGVKLPNTRKTLNQYVNDAIGFKMKPEQPLFYSENFFGTPDTINFKDEFLRVHDLKTGEILGSMHQLEIYTALFCLEYGILRPERIGVELRIYQHDRVETHIPDPQWIRVIMDKVVDFDHRIERMKMEAS
jgi:hypothetical protein